MKRRDLFRKAAAGLLAKAIGPARQRDPHGVVESRDLVIAKRPRQLQRREPRCVQDFIRVRIPDAAEEMRIGERAFQFGGEALIGMCELMLMMLLFGRVVVALFAQSVLTMLMLRL